MPIDAIHKRNLRHRINPSLRCALVARSDPSPPPPNGTGFTILTKPSPELDGTNLVVGR
jgi:hypothetical protein